jgi:hypothetical protein
MAQSKQILTSARLGLAAIVVMALLLCLATAAGMPASSAAQARSEPLAPVHNKPSAEEEIWEEEGWDEGNSEEGEAEEPEEESEESISAAECNLYATATQLVTSDRSDSVHLTVRYETDEATNVRVEYWLKGARGSFQLKPLKRHMSRRGTIQGSERLSASQMAKVRAARIFVVHLEMPGLPQSCERYCTRRLTAKRASGSRVIWSEPALDSRAIG